MKFECVWHNMLAIKPSAHLGAVVGHRDRTNLHVAVKKRACFKQGLFELCRFFVGFVTRRLYGRNFDAVSPSKQVDQVHRPLAREPPVSNY